MVASRPSRKEALLANVENMETQSLIDLHTRLLCVSVRFVIDCHTVAEHRMYAGVRAQIPTRTHRCVHGSHRSVLIPFTVRGLEKVADIQPACPCCSSTYRYSFGIPCPNFRSLMAADSRFASQELLDVELEGSPALKSKAWATGSRGVMSRWQYNTTISQTGIVSMPRVAHVASISSSCSSVEQVGGVGRGAAA